MGTSTHHHHHYLFYPPRPLEGDGSPQSQVEKPREVLIYFIPGNPGLIDYYESFLSTLRDLLNSSPSSSSASISSERTSTEPTRFHIYGQDLAGFNDGAHREPFTSRRKPHDLEYQIQHCLDGLRRLCNGIGPETGTETETEGSKPPDQNLGQTQITYDEVLLMGHSVGSYIALELCHRVLKDPDNTLLRLPGSQSSGSTSNPLPPTPRLDAAVLLFPTIHHIARSPSGWKLDLLRRTPVVGPHAHLVAQGFLSLWPESALRWFVSRALGFPPPAAETTARWLKSRDGVWQALHMGMDEMQVIGEAQWDDELWGVDREAQKRAAEGKGIGTGGGEDGPAPRFYFFFGKDDHWVATHYRDDFIRQRQRHVERTRIVVDESKIPHAFCINHSETVAEKVHVWVKEMYGVK
ncbi:hypothetical protein F4810DRAFT_459420 [Camillea tinctor]|nr:hypothetical protein F4810DRAFT_459420 [Camillea tinctor]